MESYVERFFVRIPHMKKNGHLAMLQGNVRWQFCMQVPQELVLRLHLLLAEVAQQRHHTGPTQMRR